MAPRKVLRLAVFSCVLGLASATCSTSFAKTRCWQLKDGKTVQSEDARALMVLRGAKEVACHAVSSSASAAQAKSSPQPSTSPVISPAVVAKPAVPLLQYANPIGKATTVNAEGSFFDASYNRGVKNVSDYRQHLGTDFRSSGKDPVYAVKAGTVICTVNDPNPFNSVLIVQYGDGSRGVYGHVLSIVGSGSKKVAQGQQIGTVLPSNSKFNFPAHLHYGENRLGNVGCDVRQGYGWGRAPFKATRSEATNLGWVDPVSKYNFAR